jgi:hypothetical protein
VYDWDVFMTDGGVERGAIFRCVQDRQLEAVGGFESSLDVQIDINGA